LLDSPADFRAGQGAPTSHSGHYGEEAQRRPARKDAGGSSKLLMGQDTRDACKHNVELSRGCLMVFVGVDFLHRVLVFAEK
jgi:hypothetical protein